MDRSEQKSGEGRIPNEYFDDSSLRTLYGGAAVTWVSTSAIAHAWGMVDPKMLGFWISLAVAFAGYAVSNKRSLKKLIVTPFNGLLIYLTIMGGTSFLPPPGAQVADAGGQEESREMADSLQGSQNNATPSPFFTSWSADRDLIQRASTLQQQNRKLEIQTEALEEINTDYRARLDSTREILRTIQLPPSARENLMRNLNLETINTRIPTQLDSPNFNNPNFNN